MYRACAVILSVALVSAGLPLAAQTAPGPVVHAGDSSPLVQVPAGRAIVRGEALTATNAPLPGATVRLRDARTGKIIETQVTDEAGIFEFGVVDPGTYIVELLANDRRIAAASDLLNVQPGELASTVVKLPWQAPPAGLLSRGLGAALVVASVAAASGVLAHAATGTPVSGET